MGRTVKVLTEDEHMESLVPIEVALFPNKRQPVHTIPRDKRDRRNVTMSISEGKVFSSQTIEVNHMVSCFAIKLGHYCLFRTSYYPE